MNCTIKNIGIIGGGKMGSSIFSYLSNYEFNITWCVRSNREKVQNKQTRKLNRALKNGLISNEEFSTKLDNLNISESLSELHNCDIVIECINENIDDKRKLISQLSEILSPTAIIASNSSSIHPKLLSNDQKILQRIVGLHFFFPVEMKNIIEFIPSGQNDDEVLNKTNNLLREIDRFFMQQNNNSAFILNRIVLHLQAAAYNYHIESGYTFAQIDSAVDEFLFPIGIFAMMNHIGLDLIHASAERYLEFEPEKEKFYPMFNFLKGNNSFDVVGSSDEIDVKAKKQIASNIANSYFSVYNWVVEHGYGNAYDLTYSINEYLDTDTLAWNNLNKDE